MMQIPCCYACQRPIDLIIREIGLKIDQQKIYYDAEAKSVYQCEYCKELLKPKTDKKLDI